MSATKKLLILLFVFLLSSCGGGGGGGSTTTQTSPQQLNQNIGATTNSHLTIGTSGSLSGGKVIASNSFFQPNIFNFFKKLFPSSVAYAQTVTNCSSNLMSSSSMTSWNLIGLTSASSSNSCVTGVQDAGSYVVLAVTNITDANGNNCDLVTINKSTGDTTCITLNLPNRSLTGNPSFFLDPASGQTPGQLTYNGKYFFAGFYTNVNNQNDYVGFIRLDFTGTTPTVVIPFMEYGTSADGYGVAMANNHNYFFAHFWGLENGDIILNQFTSNNGSSSSPAQGVMLTQYVVTNPSLQDPTQAQVITINQTTWTASNSYNIDINQSPLATSLLQQLSQINVSDVTQITYNNFGLSNPSNSSTHDFYFMVGTNSSSYQPCGTNTLLVHATIDTTNSSVIFQNLGGTAVNEAGLGVNSTTDGIIPSSDGSSFYSFQWSAHSPSDGKFDLVRYSRTLTANQCATSQIVYTGSQNSLSWTGNLSSVQYIRAANAMYMQDFNYNPYAGGSCVTTLGCPLQNNATVLIYDLSSGTVTAPSLTTLNGGSFYVNNEYSTVTDSRVYFGLTDNSTTPAAPVTAELTPSGFVNVIEFTNNSSSSVMITHSNVNGNSGS